MYYVLDVYFSAKTYSCGVNPVVNAGSRRVGQVRDYSPLARDVAFQDNTDPADVEAGSVTQRANQAMGPPFFGEVVFNCLGLVFHRRHVPKCSTQLASSVETDSEPFCQSG